MEFLKEIWRKETLTGKVRSRLCAYGIERNRVVLAKQLGRLCFVLRKDTDFIVKQQMEVKAWTIIDLFAD